MKNVKISEAMLNTDRYGVQVRHYHKGNSSNNFRHGKEFITEAKIVDKSLDIEDDWYVVGFGKSICAKHDLPSRKVGRHVAVGRAIRDAVKMADEVILEEVED